jgi:hypothetical protein
VNHLHKFTVVLDACVLYPAPIRDLLLSLAAEGLFIVKWSDIIQNEWVRTLLETYNACFKSCLPTNIFASCHYWNFSIFKIFLISGNYYI